MNLTDRFRKALEDVRDKTLAKAASEATVEVRAAEERGRQEVLTVFGEMFLKALPSLFTKAAAHAPAGGVSVGGKEYEGGEFIPGEVMERATEAEKAAVGGKSDGKNSAGKTRPGDGRGERAKAREKTRAEADRLIDRATDPVGRFDEGRYITTDPDKSVQEDLFAVSERAGEMVARLAEMGADKRALAKVEKAHEKWKAALAKKGERVKAAFAAVEEADERVAEAEDVEVEEVAADDFEPTNPEPDEPDDVSSDEYPADADPEPDGDSPDRQAWEDRAERWADGENAKRQKQYAAAVRAWESQPAKLAAAENRRREREKDQAVAKAERAKDSAQDKLYASVSDYEDLFTDDGGWVKDEVEDALAAVRERLDEEEAEDDEIDDETEDPEEDDTEDEDEPEAVTKSLPPNRLTREAKSLGLSLELEDLLEGVRRGVPADVWAYDDLLAACEDEWGLERVSKADRSHLVRKVIRNRLGRRQVVWVKPQEGEAADRDVPVGEDGKPTSPTPVTKTREQVAESRTVIAAAVANPDRLNPEQVRNLADHIDSITKDEAKGLLKQLGAKVSGDQMAVAGRLLETIRAGRNEGRSVGSALAEGREAGDHLPSFAAVKEARAKLAASPNDPAAGDELRRAESEHRRAARADLGRTADQQELPQPTATAGKPTLTGKTTRLVNWARGIRSKVLDSFAGTELEGAARSYFDKITDAGQIIDGEKRHAENIRKMGERVVNRDGMSKRGMGPGEVSDNAGSVEQPRDKYGVSQLESGRFVTPHTPGTYATERDAVTAARAALGDYAPRKPSAPKANPMAGEIAAEASAAAREQQASGKIKTTGGPSKMDDAIEAKLKDAVTTVLADITDRGMSPDDALAAHAERSTFGPKTREELRRRVMERAVEPEQPNPAITPAEYDRRMSQLDPRDSGQVEVPAKTRPPAADDRDVERYDAAKEKLGRMEGWQADRPSVAADSAVAGARERVRGVVGEEGRGEVARSHGKVPEKKPVTQQPAKPTEGMDTNKPTADTQKRISQIRARLAQADDLDGPGVSGGEQIALMKELDELTGKTPAQPAPADHRARAATHRQTAAGLESVARDASAEGDREAARLNAVAARASREAANTHDEVATVKRLQDREREALTADQERRRKEAEAKIGDTAGRLTEARAKEEAAKKRVEELRAGRTSPQSPTTGVDKPTTGGNTTPVQPQSAGANQGGVAMDATTTWQAAYDANFQKHKGSGLIDSASHENAILDTIKSGHDVPDEAVGDGYDLKNQVAAVRAKLSLAKEYGGDYAKRLGELAKGVGKIHQVVRDHGGGKLTVVRKQLPGGGFDEHKKGDILDTADGPKIVSAAGKPYRSTADGQTVGYQQDISVRDPKKAEIDTAKRAVAAKRAYTMSPSDPQYTATVHTALRRAGDTTPVQPQSAGAKTGGGGMSTTPKTWKFPGTSQDGHSFDATTLEQDKNGYWTVGVSHNGKVWKKMWVLHPDANGTHHGGLVWDAEKKRSVETPKRPLSREEAEQAVQMANEMYAAEDPELNHVNGDPSLMERFDGAMKNKREGRPDMSQTFLAQGARSVARTAGMGDALERGKQAADDENDRELRHLGRRK